MALLKITTPVDDETVRSLHVGETVSISGRLYTGRDAVHHRLHTGVKPPVDLAGQIIYHCGPVMVKEGDKWICKAAGPTTSSREEVVGPAALQTHRSPSFTMTGPQW